MSNNPMDAPNTDRRPPPAAPSPIVLLARLENGDRLVQIGDARMTWREVQDYAPPVDAPPE